MESAALFDADGPAALRVAAAVECVHCYSLIHDDLPAMDDDDLRRASRPYIAPSTRRRRSWPATACSPLAFDILADSTDVGTAPPGPTSSWRWRAPRASAAWPADRPSISRPRPGARRDGHHHPAGHEDRRADPVFLRGGRDRGPGGCRTARGAARIRQCDRPRLPTCRRPARPDRRQRCSWQGDRQGRAAGKATLRPCMARTGRAASFAVSSTRPGPRSRPSATAPPRWGPPHTSWRSGGGSRVRQSFSINRVVFAGPHRYGQD
jgi:hypothetical protein